MNSQESKTKLFTIPNFLSIIRLLLIPVFIIIFFSTVSFHGLLSAIILILSGITDFLDGIIARKYNIVTELGKILDPLADKFTQGTVCICLVIGKVAPLWLLIIFVLKEVLMIVGGANIIRKGMKLAASKWYGKLSTVVFYLVMIIIIAAELHGGYLVNTLILISLGFMLFSFIMYLRVFVRLFSKKK